MSSKSRGTILIETVEIPVNVGECSELLASKVGKFQHNVVKQGLDQFKNFEI